MHKYFRLFMHLVILLSALELTLLNPLNHKDSQELKIAEILNIFVCICLVLEACLKIIANGLFFCGPNSYLKRRHHQMDLLIIIVTVFLQKVPGYPLILRILRPLSLIYRVEGILLALRVLRKAIPGILNIVLITMLFYFIYGIIGVNYFKGLLYDCE